MANLYITAQGDTFDSIAFWLYGDEKFMKELIELNWKYADVLVFDSDTLLYCPDVADEDDDEDLPFWREEEDEDDEEISEDDYYEYDEEPDEEEDDEDLTDEEAEDPDPDIDDEEDSEDE